MSVFAPPSRLARDSSRKVFQYLEKSSAPGTSEAHNASPAGDNPNQYSHQKGDPSGWSTTSEVEKTGVAGEIGGIGFIGFEAAGELRGALVSSPARESESLEHRVEAGQGKKVENGEGAGEQQSGGRVAGSGTASHSSAEYQGKGGSGSRPVQAVAANKESRDSGSPQGWEGTQDRRPHMVGQEGSSGGTSSGEVGGSGSAVESQEGEGGSGEQLESFASALDYILDHLQDLDTTSPRRWLSFQAALQADSPPHCTHVMNADVLFPGN